MAIIKLGIAVVGIRGTVGGATFSANKSGPYMKQWAKGSNPRTTKQSDQRGVISDLAGRWRDLSTAEKDDWIDYADDPAQEKTNSLGETYFASGFNWYVAINQNLQATADSIRDDAPTVAAPAAPIIESWVLSVSPPGGQSNVLMTVGSPDITKDHIVHVTIQTSQGHVVRSAGLRFCIADVPNVARRINFQAPLESAWGTITLGQRGFIEVAIQNEHGRRGPVDTAFDDSA